MGNIWLNFNFYKNPKIKMLIKSLGNEAVISLQKLWIYAGENFEDGFIPYKKEFIELIAEWIPEDGKFVDYLLQEENHFLEKADGGYQIHNFIEENGNLHLKKIRREAGKKGGRPKANDNQTESKTKANDNQTESKTNFCFENVKPNSTQLNSTQLNIKEIKNKENEINEFQQNLIDARLFCDYLNKKTGKPFKPTLTTQSKLNKLSTEDGFTDFELYKLAIDNVVRRYKGTKYEDFMLNPKKILDRELFETWVNLKEPGEETPEQAAFLKILTGGV